MKSQCIIITLIDAAPNKRGNICPEYISTLEAAVLNIEQPYYLPPKPKVAVFTKVEIMFLSRATHCT